MKTCPRIRLIALALMGGLTLTQARAAGFALLEQNASGIGNAMAGSAAVADDASTVFANPAGLTQLSGIQMVGAAHAISVNSNFSGTGSGNLPGVSVGTQNGGNAGSVEVVGSLYLSVPLGERLAFGVGINTPFGLKTEYDDNWLGRFQGIKTDLKTINLNPSLAYRFSDAVSVGFGIDFQRVEVELTNATFLGVGVEGRQKLKADDNGLGWNIGALFHLGSDMQAGIAYRSRIKYTLTGDVTTVTTAGTTVGAGTFPTKAAITFPDMVTWSIVQKYSESWDLLGDLQWTHWGLVDHVDVMDTNSSARRDQLVFNFHNTWRVAMGVNYRADEKWTVKGGVAFDRSPVDNANRTIRLPDTNRFWLSSGAKYRFSKNGAIDLAYAHLFGSDSTINRTRVVAGTPFTTTITGDYEASIDIVSLQATYSF